MQHSHWDDLKNTYNQLQKPFQEMMELNVKTFQKLEYIKPDELPKLKNPDEFLERSVNVWVENGHQSLNYLRHAFQIYEKQLLALMNHVNAAKH